MGNTGQEKPERTKPLGPRKANDLDLLATHRRQFLQERLLDPLLQQEELTYNQALVLLALHHIPCSSVSELARSIGGAQSNMSTLCAILEKRGLILRAEREGDERRVNLLLSGQGQAKVEVLHSLLQSRAWKRRFNKEQRTVPFK